MNLQRVRNGFVVVLPESWWHQSDEQVRARPGDIIDVSAPGEADLLKGQMHKFEPAPEGSVPSPAAVKNPRVARHLREAAAKAAKDAPASAPAAPVAAQHAPASPQAPAPAQPPQPTPGPAPRAPARPQARPAQAELPSVDPLPSVPAKG